MMVAGGRCLFAADGEQSARRRVFTPFWIRATILPL